MLCQNQRDDEMKMSVMRSIMPCAHDYDYFAVDTFIDAYDVFYFDEFTLTRVIAALLMFAEPY